MILSHSTSDLAVSEAGARTLLKQARALVLPGDRAARHTVRAALHTKPRCDAGTVIRALPTPRLHSLVETPTVRGWPERALRAASDRANRSDTHTRAAPHLNG